MSFAKMLTRVANRRALFLSSTAVLALALAPHAARAQTVDTAQPSYDENSAPLAQNPVVFTGGTFEPTGTYTLTTPITLDAQGGTVDSTNGIAYLDGAISGPGGLAVAGPNGVLLSATNTYGGGTTINAGGLMGVATVSAIPGNLVDNGFLQFDSAPSGTFGGVISGSGSVQMFESGATVTLTGNNTAAGTLYVYGSSTAQLGAGLTSGAWAGNIADGGSVVFARSDTVTYGGAIGDFLGNSGAVTQAGTGTLILTGANTNTGGTTINAGGTIQLGDGVTNGSVTGSITDSGSLTFDYSGSANFTAGVSGSGSATVVAGHVIATAESLISGTVTVNAGAILEWGNGGGFAYLSAPNIVDNGALVINMGPLDNLGLNTPISGSGSLEIKTSQFTTFVADTYTGATTIDANAGFALQNAGSIATSSVVIDNGVFNISGANADVSIKSLAGSGTVVMVARNLTLTAANDTFSGVITDFGFGSGLTIASGTETLTGTNSYTGATTINAGATLQLGDGGATGTVAGAITDNGALMFDYSGSVTTAGAITGTGSVEVVAGTMVYTGSNNVGSVTIDSGATLQWGNGSAAYLVGPTNNVLDNGTLVVAYGGSGVGGSFQISGSGGLHIESGSLNIGGNSPYTGATTIDAGALLQLSGTGSIASSSGVTADGTFDISGTTAGASITTLSGSGGVDLGGQILTLTNAAGAFSGVIADGGTPGGTGGGLTIASGTETLTGTNTFTGLTTINAGATLKLTGTGSIANSGDPLVNGTFDISGTSGGASVVSLSGSGQVILGAETLTLTNASDNFSGGISGTGGLTIAGGTETYSGVAAFSGTTTINAGATLRLGDGAGNMGLLAGPIADNGALVFDGGAGNFALYATGITGSGSATLASGTLELVGTNTYTGATTIDAGATLRLGGGGATGTVAGDIIDNGALLFDHSGSNTFAGAISGSGSATVVAGDVIVTQDDILSGTVTVNSGATLQFGDGTNPGFLGGSSIVDNGMIELNYPTGDSLGLSAPISGTGALNAHSGLFFLHGVNTYTGATTIDASGGIGLVSGGSIASSSGVTDNGLFDISLTTAGATITTLSGAGSVTLGGQTLTLSNAANTFSGAISGSGGLTIAAGTETLTGTNTFTGLTTIDAGATLKLTGTGSIAQSGDPLVNGTFDISGTTGGASVVSLSGSGIVTLGAQTLTLTGATDTFSGVIQGAGGGFTVSAGTEVLSGTNTYTGTTTVGSGATLQLGAGGATGSVAGNIADSGLLKFDYSGPVTIAGNISGVGGSAEIVAGTLIVTASGEIGGTVTIDPGATLQWGDGTGNGFLLGDTTTLDNGAIVFDMAPGLGLGTIDTISGSGSLTVHSGEFGPGAVNTYTGLTTIDAAGSLLISGSANSIAASSGVVDNGIFDISLETSGALIKTLSGSGSVVLGTQTLTLTNAADTFSGVISGSGGLTIAAGSETLTGTNTFTGLTTIDSGATLKLTGTGSIAQSADPLVNGTFDISGTTSGASVISLSGSGIVTLGAQTLTLTGAQDTFSGVIQGAGGGFTVAAGTEVLTGTNTYTGATTINSGATLQLGAGGATGTVAGDITDNGSLVLDYGVDTIYGGVISGTGSVTVSPTGVGVYFTGNSTYTGGTTIGAGTALFLGNGGTSGSIVGNVLVNGGDLVFDRTDPVTFGGTISGSGWITLLGGDTVTLTADNTFTGAPNIQPGSTLQLGNGGTTGSLAANLINDFGGLVFDHSNAITYAGVIQQSGSVTIGGTGPVTFTGANTYTGGTTINAAATSSSGPAEPPAPWSAISSTTGP
jgi:fibronectin-binding autotransporter adhesin